MPASRNASGKSCSSPPAVNKHCARSVELLAWAIEAADKDRSDAWYLRETSHGLRLMAGRLLACGLRRSRLRISVIGPVSDDVLGKLGGEIEDGFKWIPGGGVSGHAAGQSRRCSFAVEGCDGCFHRWRDDASKAIGQLGRAHTQKQYITYRPCSGASCRNLNQVPNNFGR